MMATAPESSRAATSPYTPVAAHELRRQKSMPAALAATFVSCGSGGARGRWPRNLRDDDDGNGDGELRVRSPRPGAGGVGAVVRALWAWIARSSRRKVVIMSRTGSSVKEQQYGHEEYAQNFDDGGAAREPENLSRSFSARYARQASAVPRGTSGLAVAGVDEISSFLLTLRPSVLDRRHGLNSQVIDRGVLSV